MRRLAVITILTLGLFLMVPADAVMADELMDVDLYISPDTYESLTFDVGEGVRFYGDVKTDIAYQMRLFIYDSENFEEWIWNRESEYLCRVYFADSGRTFNFTVPTADVWRFCFVNVFLDTVIHVTGHIYTQTPDTTTTPTTTTTTDEGQTMTDPLPLLAGVGVVAIIAVAVLTKRHTRPDARFLIICPYCGAKNEQGIIKCRKCSAEI